MEVITLSNFLEDVIKAHDQIDHNKVNDLIELFEKGFHEDRTFYSFGNGGSGAAASHFCEDLGKGTLFDLDGHKRFRAMSLTDNMPYILAWANDHGYETIFEQQLRNFAHEGDFAIGISGSGNSENVLRAIQYSNQKGLITIGFTGFDGGKLGKSVQHHIHIESEDMGIVESVHETLMHYIVMALKQRVWASIEETKMNKRKDFSIGG